MISVGSSKGSSMIALAILVILTTDVVAQNVGTVAGTAIAASNGETVPGVRVHFPDLELGTVTSDEGRFVIPGVPGGQHEIRAELFGCRLTSELIDVRPGERVAVDITLGRRVINVERMVVTGVASETPEGELPFTVDHVEVEDAQSGVIPTAEGVIQGRVAGAEVVRGSGQPGEAPSVQLRGPRSVSGSQDPLVVVDGVITATGLVGVDPLDIETMEVLKGATAAAIYGSRGQAGVIRITTKRGVVSTADDPEPLVIVNGLITSEGLEGIDPRNVQRMEMLDSTAATVLFGSRAQAGVVQITTKSASSSDDGTRVTGCVDPSFR